MRLAAVTAVLLLVAILDTATAIFALTPCEEGWVQLGDNRCVQYFKTKKTFEDAKDECLMVSANLVSVHSQEELDNLVSVIWEKDSKDKQREPLWIGAERSDGEFHNADGTEFDFQPWANGQPVKAKSKNCITLVYRGEPAWSNTMCSKEHTYACAKDASIPLG